MAEIKTLNVRFQQKYDTAENWESSSILLLAGEMAVESDTGKFKFGDGEHVFSELNYAGVDTAQLEAIEDNYYEVIPTGEETDEEAILRVATKAAKGDIAVVKRGIDTDEAGLYTRESMTAYMFDGENWSALDGNYSASNVYLPKDITLAGDFSSIGNYQKGATIEAGTSLEALFNGMLQKELYPSVDKPSISISASGGSAEVGATFTLPTATLKVDDVGSYTYGPATGIKFTAGNLKLAQGAVASATNYATNQSDSAAGATITLKATGSNTTYGDSAINFKFNASGTYTQGAVPVSNLGNPCATHPESGATLQIASGTATATEKSINFTGWRNYWYGFISTTDYQTIVRSASDNKVGDGTKTLTAGGAAISNKTLPTITAAAGDRMPVVVMKTGTKSVKSATMPSSLNAPVTFTKLGTVQLAGLGGYSPTSYDVWGYVADDMPVGADFSIVIG